MIGGFQADSILRLDLHVCFPGPPAKANEKIKVAGAAMVSRFMTPLEPS